MQISSASRHVRPHGALLSLFLIACGSRTASQSNVSSASSASAAQAPAIPATDIFSKDPCQLVSASEAEAYLGSLLHPPYRADDDHTTADSTGTVCLYRGNDGRSLEVSVIWMDGKSRIKQYTNGLLTKLNMNLADQGKADTMSAAWDQAAVHDNSLYALKADTLVQIDYGAAKIDLPAATKLAEDAISRLGKPLAYNGGAASVNAPGPLVQPRDPCTLLTRQEVEGVLGSLTGDPTTDDEGCLYHTGTRTVQLSVRWTGGFRALASDRSAQANANALVGQQYISGSDMQKALQGRAKLYAKANVDNLDLDTTVAGPWADSRRTQVLEVVKKDVYMKMDLTQVTAAQATSLLTIAMNKI